MAIYLKIISRKGTREILEELDKKGNLSYRQIEDLIKNPRTTSQRLSELTKLKLIKRQVMQNQYRTVRYSLTTKGKNTINILKKLNHILQEVKQK